MILEAMLKVTDMSVYCLINHGEKVKFDQFKSGMFNGLDIDDAPIEEKVSQEIS